MSDFSVNFPSRQPEVPREDASHPPTLTPAQLQAASEAISQTGALFPLDEEALLRMITHAPEAIPQVVQTRSLSASIRFRLAQCLAIKNPRLLVTHLQDFRIEDEAQRLELVLQVAKSTKATFPYTALESWDLQPHNRLQLAFHLAKLSPISLASHIHLFKIPEDKDRIQLALRILRAQPSAVLEHLSKFDLQPPPVVIQLLSYTRSFIRTCCTKYQQTRAQIDFIQHQQRLFEYFLDLSEPELEEIWGHLQNPEKKEIFEAYTTSLIEARQVYPNPPIFLLLAHPTCLTYFNTVRTQRLYFATFYLIFSFMEALKAPDLPVLEAMLPTIDPSLTSSHPLQAVTSQLCNKIERQKDAAKVQFLLHTLRQIFSSTGLSLLHQWQFLALINKEGAFSALHPQAAATLPAISRAQGFSKMLRYCSYIRVLCLLDLQSHLVSKQSADSRIDLSVETLQSLLAFCIPMIFNLEATPSNCKAVQDHILSLPHYEDLIVYTLSLQEAQEEETLKALHLFVKNLLTQAYPQARYEPKISPHLKRLATQAPSIYMQWQQGSSYHFQDLAHHLPKTQQSPHFLALLQDKICRHKHLQQEQIPLLWTYLKDPTQYETLLSQCSADANKDTSLKLQVACMELTRQHATTVEARISQLGHIQTLILSFDNDSDQASWNPFLTDIKDLISSLQTVRNLQSDAYKDWSVVNTDDPWTLCRAPTVIGGSCQDIYATTEYNKCLLALPMDGKNRLLAVMDPQGNMKARATLKLMLDAHDHPVLFMEPIYPSTAKPEWSYALKHMAQLCAKNMDISLWTTEPSTHHVPHTLISKGSPAPFEYIDASEDGVCEKGIFSFQAYRME